MFCMFYTMEHNYFFYGELERFITTKGGDGLCVPMMDYNVLEHNINELFQ